MGAVVKTRVLILSDTHCATLSKHDSDPDRTFQRALPLADLLIHCGDLTDSGTMGEYQQALSMLKEIDAPVKLVIAGNHDLSLDEDYVLDHVGRNGAMGYWEKVETRGAALSKVKLARDLWETAGRRATTEGVTFLNEGVHQINLQNGARVNVYASPYTPAFCDFAFAYKRDEDRFNPAESSRWDAKNIAISPIPSCSSSHSPVDIVVTHGPPRGRLDNTVRGVDAGCPHLLRALMSARPLVHCFGHIHEGWGAERVEWSAGADGVAANPVSIAD